MKRFVFWLVGLTVFAAASCTFSCKEKHTTVVTNADADFVDVRMLVNDSVIDAGELLFIIEPLFYEVDMAGTADNYNRDMRKFTDSQRYVYAVQQYLDDVQQEGHYGLFAGFTGMVWKDALEGLQKMGLDKSHAILQAAANRLGGNPSLDLDPRLKQLKESDAVFDTLDMQAQRLDSVARHVMMDFVKRRRNDFYFDHIVHRPKIHGDDGAVYSSWQEAREAHCAAR